MWILLDTLFEKDLASSDLLRLAHICSHYTLQEHQRIRTFAIYQTFVTLKFVLWAMEIFTFSSIQPI